MHIIAASSHSLSQGYTHKPAFLLTLMFSGTIPPPLSLFGQGEPQSLICAVALRLDVPVVQGQKIKHPSCPPLVGLLPSDALNWRLSTKALTEKLRLMANDFEQNKCLRVTTMKVL